MPSPRVVDNDPSAAEALQALITLSVAIRERSADLWPPDTALLFGALLQEVKGASAGAPRVV
jgi:hypothetical protein